MKSKIFLTIILALFISISSSAQLKDEKFRATLDGIGVFNLEFKSSIYTLSDAEDTIMVNGNYNIEGDTLIFNDIKGPLACLPDVKGIYTFVLDRRALKLTLIEDKCLGRANIAVVTWNEAKTNDEK